MNNNIKNQSGIDTAKIYARKDIESDSERNKNKKNNDKKSKNKFK